MTDENKHPPGGVEPSVGITIGELARSTSRPCFDMPPPPMPPFRLRSAPSPLLLPLLLPLKGPLLLPRAPLGQEPLPRGEMRPFCNLLMGSPSTKVLVARSCTVSG